MRSVFIGTVDISWHCLRAILETGTEVRDTFLLPRERSARTSAYKSFDDIGRKYGISVHETLDVNLSENVQLIKRAAPDVIFVIGWPRLVKRELLSLAPLGCIGIHSSPLPKYRGGAPVNWGLIHGETNWGVTLFYLDEGADTGDIIAQEFFPLTLDDTCRSVYDKATEASVKLLRYYVPMIGQGHAPRTPQDHSQATLFPQRKPEQGEIDWNKTAMELYNWIRALTHPYPGAFTFMPDGRKVYIWQASLPSMAVGEEDGKQAIPGEVAEVKAEHGVVVATGQGRLLVTLTQMEGGGEARADIVALTEGIEPGTGFISGRTQE